MSRDGEERERESNVSCTCARHSAIIAGNNIPHFIPSSLRSTYRAREVTTRHEREILEFSSSGISKVPVTAHFSPPLSLVRCFTWKTREKERGVCVRERERREKGEKNNSKLWHHISYAPDIACTLTKMYALVHVRDAQYTTTINR